MEISSMYKKDGEMIYSAQGKYWIDHKKFKLEATNIYKFMQNELNCMNSIGLSSKFFTTNFFLRFNYGPGYSFDSWTFTMNNNFFENTFINLGVFKDLNDFTKDSSQIGILHQINKKLQTKLMLKEFRSLSAGLKFNDKHKNSVNFCLEKDLKDEQSELKWGLKFDLKI